jgi:hypothetical protein
MSHMLDSGWSPRTALPPCIAISAAFAYSLYILAAPHRYRLENVVIVFVLAAAFQKSFKYLYPDDLVNIVFAHATFIWLVHVAHVTLVQGDANYIAGNPTQSGAQALKEGGWTSISASGLGPYHKAYKLLYNTRGIGTSWQVVKTQQPVVEDKTVYKQLRKRFLWQRLLTIFGRYVALIVFYEVSELLGWPIGSSLLDTLDNPLPPSRIC